ncbi:MAG: neutral zinc metallopeptidase [Gammaproteobacteria bacterium]
MRWKDGRRSDNVEDQRGQRTGRRRSPRNILFPRGVRRGVKSSGGGGGMLIIMAILAMLFFDFNPLTLLQGGGSSPGRAQTQAPTMPTSEIPRLPRSGEMGNAPDTRFQIPQQQVRDSMKEFISVVLADTEDAWHKVFRQNGKVYSEPKLVLFSGAAQSACGYAESAMGPFYCPGDHKVYIDLSFYKDLRDKGVSGDFAQAYVIAHEVGHHVQNLLGISSKVQELRQRSGKSEGNQLSVRLELQADCLAGVWGNHADRTRGILEQGDIEEALMAATSIGDDRLQKQARGYVTPESFTHGTSEQRVRWFTKGLKAGDISTCNTFEVGSL